ncbi:MAG TPA: hypothetical protein VKY85_24240, partial [Candidatus Angelobacter sp.]|nr:hypothetical protein [Candidatus Angelobacter sp.]
WAREHHGNGRTEVECYFCVFFSSSPARRFRIVVWNPEFMLPGMFVLPFIPSDHVVGFAEFQHLLPRAARVPGTCPLDDPGTASSLLRGATQDAIEAIGTRDQQMLVVLQAGWKLPIEVLQALASAQGSR